MAFIDFVVFALYMIGILGIGFYFFFKNKGNEDYYVGGRQMSASHIGLSVVATDVGGGFSIGLGGLGYAMGLAGSWLLFTGLIGAWVSAVLIIPKVKKIDTKLGMLTYPDFLKHRYSKEVAIVAALISGIGYLGFTGAQVLAGAKLFSAAVIDIKNLPFGLTSFQFSLLVIGAIIIIYTVLGGIKAVIYTDTVQWIVLLIGLIFLAIPFALYEIGGISELKRLVPAGHLSLLNVSLRQFVNWMVTIIPIWFIAMTLYQRIYACKNEKEAKKAWFIAGIFEYPIMAFMGVVLGMCSRVLYEGVDPEMGLPLLIQGVLPIGITGIVISAYFSAIMSTADSCLMASSGNFVNDLLLAVIKRKLSDKANIIISQGVTLLLGVFAISLAITESGVLDAIILAYSFMVAGLFIPTLGAYFWKRSSSLAAFFSMIGGGSTALFLIIMEKLGQKMVLPLKLDPSFYGICVSLVIFVALTLIYPDRTEKKALE